ncbi:MAG: CapA family protein [Bacteroidales bacterium]|nr:CapA family protein [Bacteroidales bacterium]
MKNLCKYLSLLCLAVGIPAAAQSISSPAGPGSPFDMSRFFWSKVRTDVAMPPQYDTISFRIIGDVMMHTGQIDYARRNGGFDFHPFLDSIAVDLSSATVAIANMEFALGGEPYTGYPAFSAPDSYANYVRDMGIDVFLTANNHITDKGTRGLRRTFDIYDTLQNVVHARQNPTMLSVHGVKFAIINCTYGTNSGQSAKPGDELYIPFISDRQFILDSVKEAKELGADFIIALPHWGSEYKLQHNAAQESFAKDLAKTGVDVIVGAHPHCVQDHGTVAGIPVYYSIGNAVSNMSAVNTQLEQMVTLRFARRTDGSYEMLEPSHDWLWCSRPGFLNHGYCTIKVKDFIGRRKVWKNPSDYDKMISTYKRISGE